MQYDQNTLGHDSIVLPNSTQTEAAANETKAVSEEHYYNSPADYAPTQEPKEV